MPSIGGTGIGRVPRRDSRPGCESGLSTCLTARRTCAASTPALCGSSTTDCRPRLISAMTDSYTPQELMVAVASREIRDGDLVFVGMPLAGLAYAVARRAHAPSRRGLCARRVGRD